MDKESLSIGMNSPKKYSYYAFISYNSADEKWAKWLQHGLEHYSIPTGIKKRHSNLPNKIRPVFWYKSDLAGTMLHPSLHKELDESQYLLVICSPHSAKSSYVNEEVQFFVDLGRIDKIVPVIVDGEPYAENPTIECFPPAILGLPKEKELRGINMQEYKKKKGLINVIATLLGIRFDALWERHKKRRRSQLLYLSAIIGLSMMAIYLFAVPMHLNIHLVDEKTTLPMPKNAKLKVDDSYYLLSELDTVIDMKLNGIDKLRDISIQFCGKYYEIIDTIFDCNIFYYREINLHLKRDRTFAVFQGKVIDIQGLPVQDATIEIENITSKTDSTGNYNVEIPINKQDTVKTIKIYKEGYDSIIKQEIPSDNATIILF